MYVNFFQNWEMRRIWGGGGLGQCDVTAKQSQYNNQFFDERTKLIQIIMIKKMMNMKLSE